MSLKNTIERHFKNDKLIARIVFSIILTYITITGIIIVSDDQDFNLNFINLIVSIFIIDGIKIIVQSLSRKTKFDLREDLSKVSVIIATYNGSSTLPMVIENLLTKFNPPNIIVVSDASTDDTVAVAKKYKVQVQDLKINVGKVAAINRGLELVKTPYVLILDDDTLLADAVIPTNLLDEGYEGVAFKVLPYKAGWLSLLQTHEYRKSMYIGREFHNNTGTVVTISGAIGLFNTHELKRQIAIHSSEFSGEDLQRTLLIHLKKPSKGVVIADSIVKTVVPDTLLSLFRQRVYGWCPGMYANTFNFFKIILKKRVPLKLKVEALFELFIVILFDPIRFLAIPVLLFNPNYFLVFYLSYITIETLPWLTLGRKEPFWVILITPFYGIFNLVAKITAMAVFIYRRTTKFIGRHKRPDSYKIARTPVKHLSTTIATALYFILLTPYVLLTANTLELEAADYYPTYVKAQTVYAKSASKIALMSKNNNKVQDKLEGKNEDKKVVDANKIASIEDCIDKEFNIVATRGDGLWRLTKKAIELCAIQAGHTYSNYEIDLLTSKNANLADRIDVLENQEYTIKLVELTI